MGHHSSKRFQLVLRLLHYQQKKMKAVAVLLLASLALASASALPKTSHKLSYRQAMKAKGIVCDICTLVVTEIDKLLVEGTDSVVDLVEELCSGIDGLFQELELLVMP